jgi:hypothetical protein
MGADFIQGVPVRRLGNGQIRIHSKAALRYLSIQIVGAEPVQVGRFLLDAAILLQRRPAEHTVMDRHAILGKHCFAHGSASTTERGFLEKSGLAVESGIEDSRDASPASIRIVDSSVDVLDAVVDAVLEFTVVRPRAFASDFVGLTTIARNQRQRG